MSSALKHRARIGLVVLLAVHAGLALHWIATDSTPLQWDSASHVGQAFKSRHAFLRSSPPIRAKLIPAEWRLAAFEHPAVARVLAGPLAGVANGFEALYRGADYPPLAFVTGGATAALLGAAPDAVVIGMSLLWFLVTIVATYLFVAEGRGPGAALLAAFLVAGNPLLLGLSRIPMTDGALAALVAVAMWGVLRCRGFEDRRGSWLLGLACGLGMLAKQPFLVLLGPPVAWIAALALVAWRRDEPGARVRLGNLGCALLVAALIAGPWYLFPPYVTSMLGNPLRLGAFGSPLEGGAALWSFERALVYPREIVHTAMGPFLALAAAFGVVALAFDRRARERGPVALALLGAIAFFGYLHPIQASRFLAPTMPLFAAATAISIYSIPSRVLRGLAVALLVPVTLATIYGSTISDLGEAPRLVPGLGIETRFFSLHTGDTHPPDPRPWAHDDMLAAVDRHRPPGPGLAWIHVIENGMPYHSHLKAISTPDRRLLEDGYPVRTVEVAESLGHVPDETPFFLIVSLQDGFEQQPGPTHHQWLNASDRDVLARLQDRDPIARAEDLPFGLRVLLYALPSKVALLGRESSAEGGS